MLTVVPLDTYDAGAAMTRKELAALEKVFDAEIHDRLPFQSKARIYQQLQDDGLLKPMERVFGHDPLAVTCAGYQLTLAGHLAYCMSCG